MSNAIDDMNYANDPRNCAPAAEVHTLYMDDGTERELPTKWVVCGVCNGAGKHVNPAIDCGGISAEQFHDDPDFGDSYRRGDYDVPCNSCKGRTTVAVVDLDKLNAGERAAYELQIEDDAKYEAERLSEIRMGA